jgi:hypothetical protein
MDKTTVQFLLESYRAQDANDPIFAEALREIAADPELAAWFAERQRFDAVIAAALREVEVPGDVKDRILRGSPAVTPFPVPHRAGIWATLGSIAAVLLLGLFSWQFLVPHPRAIDPLAMQAITFTSKMPALQFVCFNPAAVAKWVNAQPDSQKVGLTLPPPDKSMSMVMIGSSIVNWNGHPVVMVCLQDGKRMAMLYVMKASDVPGMKEGESETVQHGDWVVRTTDDHGQIHVLTARGAPGDLDFRMPFS